MLGIYQAHGAKRMTLDDIVPPFDDLKKTDEQKLKERTLKKLAIVKRRELAAKVALQKYKER